MADVRDNTQWIFHNAFHNRLARLRRLKRICYGHWKPSAEDCKARYPPERKKDKNGVTNGSFSPKRWDKISLCWGFPYLYIWFIPTEHDFHMFLSLPLILVKKESSTLRLKPSVELHTKTNHHYQYTPRHRLFQAAIFSFTLILFYSQNRKEWQHTHIFFYVQQ